MVYRRLRFQQLRQQAHAYLQVPPDSVVDVAHIIFAMHAFAPTYLRELSHHPYDDQSVLFSRLGLTKDTARMTLCDSILGGLLTDDAPAYAGKTVILLKIRSAAKQSGDLTYSFSGVQSSFSIVFPPHSILEPEYITKAFYGVF